MIDNEPLTNNNANHQQCRVLFSLLYRIIMNGFERIRSVALGDLPPDKAVINGTVFNAFTNEFIQRQSIWIKDGIIAYVGPENSPPCSAYTEIIDADGMTILPGLIDGHTHVLNRSGVEEFVRFVIPTGVTTVVTETTEFGSVAGKVGIDAFIRALHDQPIRFYYTVSPLCGLTLSEEGLALSAEETLALVEEPECLGLGEVYWGNYFIPGHQGERIRDLVNTVLKRGKRVEGHAAGAHGRKLQAYIGSGISSCHEATTEQDVLERLRLGLWTMIREGAIRKELEAVSAIFAKGLDLRRIILTTDGGDPEEFVANGYLDASVKRALNLGVPPDRVYQMVTLNVSEHFRLDHLLGSLSPGKLADLVIIPSPEAYSPQFIMCNGNVLFRDSQPIVKARQASFPPSLFDTVRVDDRSFPGVPNQGMVRAIELVTRLVTKESIVNLGNPQEAQDVLFLLDMERTGRQKSFMGFLKGFGLQRGACGTTMCWDSMDMIIIGRDAVSMRTAIGRLREIGGGAVFAVGSEIVTEFPAPLCGVVSLAPMEELYRTIKTVEGHLRANGVPWERPLLTIDILTTAAIPHLRITHDGYVRLKDRQVLSWKI